MQQSMAAMKANTSCSKMVSFRLTAKHIDMLNELSAATGRPKSEHLRKGIEAMHRAANLVEHTRSKESF